MLLDKLWYEKQCSLSKLLLAIPLAPLSLIFGTAARLRRILYARGILHSSAPLVPVVVVGGITVGGSGKTPLCRSLVHYLYTQGFKPGIVSRGYKGHSQHYPLLVQEDSNPLECGDEPLLLKRSLKQEAVVVVDPVRTRGAEYLKTLGVDLIVTDDGMQHYALQRDVEICVLDASRMLGNRRLLPLGPLREGAWRLKTVDAVVSNGATLVDHNNFSMRLIPQPPHTLDPDSTATLQRGTEVYALAGIGNPERFYQTVEDLGLKIVKKISVADHAKLSDSELAAYTQRYPVVMTSKDAIKYSAQQVHNVFVIEVNAELTSSFYDCVLSKIRNSKNKISKRAEQQKAAQG
ncbi:MAG: tetraacyldisaccharide 4'-kinase [Succinivibrio sp.]|nr:tetraacyldisaccharide 4'-kinase [Succinivibrio sp.]